MVRAVAERTYFALCLALGRLLRAGRYSAVRVVDADGVPEVRKRRRFYAPVLVWLGEPLVRVLDTGVRVLPQRAWVERERVCYGALHGAAIRAVDGGRTLVLPWLAGRPLASLLEDRAVAESARAGAVEHAVVALREMHRLGLTHGDAMAENVMVDLDAGVARWFDFETVHDARRPMVWRRADDVRALLVTCLVRIDPARRAAVVGHVLDVYGDEGVARVLARSVGSVLRRPLAFHLGQAGVSRAGYREIGRLLRERGGRTE